LQLLHIALEADTQVIRWALQRFADF
jgi:hypothetical protein